MPFFDGVTLHFDKSPAWLTIRRMLTGLPPRCRHPPCPLCGSSSPGGRSAPGRRPGGLASFARRRPRRSRRTASASVEDRGLQGEFIAIDDLPANVRVQEACSGGDSPAGVRSRRPVTSAADAIRLRLRRLAHWARDAHSTAPHSYPGGLKESCPTRSDPYRTRCRDIVEVPSSSRDTAIWEITTSPGVAPSHASHNATSGQLPDQS